jgi:hypothetical protein
MHPDTRFRNGWRAATKLRETTPNMCFGPKVVDWACSLRKTKKLIRWQKLVLVCTPDTRFRNGWRAATKLRETTPNMSFGPKVVDWECSLWKTMKLIRWQKLVLCMHRDTRIRNGWHAATKLRETTPNMSFGPKLVDWACSLHKTKKLIRWQKLVLSMHPDTRFRNGWRAATKLRETTPNMSCGPKVVDWACSLWKTKKQFRGQKLVLCMHRDTRFRNGWRAATKLRETSPNMSFGPKVVDWACSLRKTKKLIWWQKFVLWMQPNIHFRNGWRAATKLRETTPNMSFGPKLVDRACSMRKTKKWYRWQKLVLVCTLTPVFGMGDVRQRNCAKPPETCVLDLN